MVPSHCFLVVLGLAFWGVCRRNQRVQSKGCDRMHDGMSFVAPHCY